jgi:predicted transcriptional regulator
MKKDDKLVAVSKILTKKISDKDKSFLQIIQEKKEISYEDLADELGIHPSNVGRRATKLIKEGLIIKTKDGKKNSLLWIGGIPALEADIKKASINHIPASVLAEYYDTMILQPFSIFSLLFENSYWEIFSNLKPGLNEVELSQRVGKALSLDSIRRILVTCSAHNIITLKNIREPAFNEISKMFEPLYRIDSVNEEYLNQLILIRGLASAVVCRIEGTRPDNFNHIYDSVLEINERLFYQLMEKIESSDNINDQDILKKLIFNYDFALDMERISRDNHWKNKIKNSQITHLDAKSNHIFVDHSTNEKWKNEMIRSLK